MNGFATTRALKTLTRQVLGGVAGTPDLEIPCPKDHRIRLVMLSANYTLANTNDDLIQLEYYLNSVLVAVWTTVILENAAGRIAGFLGGSYRPNTLNEIDPVTGEALYNLLEADVCMPLPEFWSDVRIGIALIGGDSAVADSLTLIYEERWD